MWFHSFLGQNKTQFSVSFCIFGLLLFDLEILLVYPYSVSSYTNDLYGLAMMMVFFVLLTLGFIFELGKNALTIESRQTSSYNNGKTSNPHVFTVLNKTLKSEIGIPEILADVNTMLPQLADFVNKFHTTVNQTGISVITDAEGNMSIDVPKNMSADIANTIAKKINIIDNLVTTRGQEINELLQKGINLESKLKTADSNYVSQLTDKIQEFKRLNSLYKH